MASGDIYLDKYSGWYSVSDEAYYDEDEVEESNGKKISKSSGSTVDWVESNGLIFLNYQIGLLNFWNIIKKMRILYYQSQTRKNEVVKFVEKGLNDLSVSRTSFSWGIPVPKTKNILFMYG